MLYEIVETTVSNDKNVCYTVFRHNISIGKDNADTYGISAADIAKSSFIDDVVTNKTEIPKLLNCLSRNSISVNDFKEYITDYVDKL